MGWYFQESLLGTLCPHNIAPFTRCFQTKPSPALSFSCTIAFLTLSSHKPFLFPLKCPYMFCPCSLTFLTLLAVHMASLNYCLPPVTFMDHPDLWPRHFSTRLLTSTPSVPLSTIKFHVLTECAALRAPIPSLPNLSGGGTTNGRRNIMIINSPMKQKVPEPSNKDKVSNSIALQE